MEGSVVRKKIAKHGMCNSNVLAIAPTATISNIIPTPCIEPNYKNIYVKFNHSGDFVVLNNELVKDLKKADLWNQEMLDQLNYFDGDLDAIDDIPETLLVQRHEDHLLPAHPPGLHIEKSTVDAKMEQRGVMATQTAATAAGAMTFAAEEKNACSIDAMLNGGTWEACRWDLSLALHCPHHGNFSEGRIRHAKRDSKTP